MEDPRPNAPVSARAEVGIAADVREVWAVIADIAAWPSWNPTVREARFEHELEVGARFRFSTHLGAFSCRLTEVHAPRALAWRGRMLTLRQGQRWRLEPGPAATHVWVDATMSGLGARVFRDRLQERLGDDIQALVRLLKLEAEARAAERLAGEPVPGQPPGAQDDG